MECKQSPELSDRAFKELKEIALEEYGAALGDEEIREMGNRLLRLFALLLKPDSSAEILSGTECRALAYVHSSICHKNKQPTVRGIAAAVDRRSSRSGLRMMQVLLRRGFISKDTSGKIMLREDLKLCDISETL